MKQINDFVRFIQGQDEFIPDAHAYVLGHPDSGDLTLVDAGLMGKADYKIQAIRRLGIDPSMIRRIIMTHTHLDHVGCLPEIRQALPGAQVWMHRAEADPLERGDESHLYGMDMFRQMCRAQYGITEGAFSGPIARKLEGGETLDLGGSSWEVLHVPGHSAGSLALYNKEGRILVAGDTVYADYAIGRFDLHGASGAELYDSLMLLSSLDVEILLPGHNRIVEGLGPRYILETARQWEAYLK